MKRSIRKSGLVFGAVAVVLVMLSSVTAVPNVGSEIVIESIEEQKAAIIKQFEDIWLNLLEDESLQIAEWQGNNDINPDQDFEDLFDTEGFLNFIVSDEFIDILNDHFNDFLSNEGILLLFNTDEMQAYVNSDEFLYFANSDEVQYILEKLDEDDDQIVNLGVSTGEMGVQQTFPLVLEGYLGTDPVSCPVENGGFDVETLEYETPGLDLLEFLLVTLVLFIIALILWIPIIIYVTLLAPMYLWTMYLEYFGELYSYISTF